MLTAVYATKLMTLTKVVYILVIATIQYIVGFYYFYLFLFLTFLKLYYRETRDINFQNQSFLSHTVPLKNVRTSAARKDNLTEFRLQA